MGRPLRAATGGVVYHVLNRANARMQLFATPADYDAFERVLAEAHERRAMRTLAYRMMPTHWHLVIWPRADGELSPCMAWVTLTPTQRWQAHRHTAGSGHLCQGRCKAVPVQRDAPLLTVCRSGERNAVRAGLVRRAEDWRGSRLWRRTHGEAAAQAWLSEGPVPRPRQWAAWGQEPQTPAALEALRRCVTRGQPFGSESWVQRTARRLGLDSTLRSRGRPKKHSKGDSKGS